MTRPVLIIDDDDLKGNMTVRFVRVVSDRESFRVKYLKQAIFMLKGKPLAVITNWKFPFEHGDPSRKHGHVITALCHDMNIPCLVNAVHSPPENLPPGTIWPDAAGDFNEVLKKFLNDLPRAPT